MRSTIVSVLVTLLLAVSFASTPEVQPIQGHELQDSGKGDAPSFDWIFTNILDVNASVYQAHPGAIIHVYVTVEVTWDVFDFSGYAVSAFYESSLIEEKVFIVLWSGHTIDTLDFAWNTSGLEPGSYLISAATSTGAFYEDGHVRILQTLTVPDDYPTIQAAINAAGDGDTVFVRSGTYYEHVVVNKSLAVVGEDRASTWVHGSGSDAVFRVTENNVTLQGFSLESASYGVYLLNANNSRVIGNFIDDVVVGGIILDDSCNNTIEANLVEDFPSLGIAIVADSEFNIIKGNEVQGCHDYGINVMANHNLVVGNTIRNCSTALDVFGSNNTLYHNNVIDNDIPVIAGGSHFWDNNCTGNYWDDYRARYPNASFDIWGIGDTPYLIDASNQDNCPLLNVFWNPCDTDHDLDVDIFDIVKVCHFYGIPYWNEDCCHVDLAAPYGEIDIFDIVTIAMCYGEEYSS